MNQDNSTNRRTGNHPESVLIPDWVAPVKSCLARIHRWRIPPNWNVLDWFDEMRSAAMLAALEAMQVFDAGRGTPFDAFLRSRIFARALTFYRQEWAYGSRHVDSGSPEDQERHIPDQILFISTNHIDPARETVDEALALLPEQDRWLLKELYMQERTEAELGRQLGLSQRAVSKHKHAALCRLRQQLDG